MAVAVKPTRLTKPAIADAPSMFRGWILHQFPHLDTHIIVFAEGITEGDVHAHIRQCNEYNSVSTDLYVA